MVEMNLLQPLVDSARGEQEPALSLAGCSSSKAEALFFG